jgi:hypothetical protein|nr:MAG TPA: hypothetical protein [Caudoviricetes sp.]
MADTIELIKRHTQEIDEYMNKNGKYSFHRFSDGSIHYKASIFNDISRIEYTCPTPIEPVRELEELKEITKTNDVFVTINDFITFEGCDAILGDTGIEFYGLSVEIKYTGIHSLIIDFNHDLKELLHKIKKGYFGEIVFINGVETGVHDFVLLESYLVYFPCDDSHAHGKYVGYDDINIIADAECRNIYWR